MKSPATRRATISPFLRKIRLDSFLSFAPGSEAVELGPLNVLIGPNGSGKSNLIDAIEFLRATPTDLASLVREGGGAAEWLWKGQGKPTGATVDVETGSSLHWKRSVRYRAEFAAVNARLEILDEAVENSDGDPGHPDVMFYYRFQRGDPIIQRTIPGPGGGPVARHLKRESLLLDQSVFAQRKDPDEYPVVTWLGQQFGAVQSFREWTFGRATPLRSPQPADLPEGGLLPDARNLALILNQIEHKDGRHFDELLKRFLPRFERMSTRISGGTVQFYLHEAGLGAPVPATRLSDGTIRFVALLAALLTPAPPPLLCIEEPELGLHPDAASLIAEVLREASSRMQLIVTTHSDALVSALSDDPACVVACEHGGHGTRLRRLDPVDLAHWLDSYRLGDLWRMGELGANP